MRRTTPTSLVTPEELRTDMAMTRQQGYAFSDGDVAVGIAGIAVPVLDADGALAGAVAIAGLADPVRERLAELALALTEEVAVLQRVKRL